MRHGTRLDPPNRFETTHSERDDSHVEWDTEYLQGRSDRNIEYLNDERGLELDADSVDALTEYLRTL